METGKLVGEKMGRIAEGGYLGSWFCSQQLDRHEQSGNDRPGRECHQGGKPHLPSGEKL